MGAVLEGGYEIDIAFGDGLDVIDEPHDRPLDLFVLALEMAAERRLRQQLTVSELSQQVIRYTAFILPFLVIVLIAFVLKDHPQPRTQHRLRAQHVLEPWDAVLG